MSKVATLTLALSVIGDGVNEQYAPAVVIANQASPGGATPQALTTGFNSIAVPAGAKGCIISPPANSTITKTLKGITGDTGFPLATAVDSPLNWDGNAPATIGITASGGETVTIYWR